MTKEELFALMKGTTGACGYGASVTSSTICFLITDGACSLFGAKEASVPSSWYVAS